VVVVEEEVAPYHSHWDLTRTIWHACLRVLVAAKLFPDGTLCSIQLEVFEALQNTDYVLTTPRSVRHPLHGRSRWYADRASLVEYIFCLRYLCPDTRHDGRMGAIQTLFNSLLGPCSCMLPRLT
jgi:hypothetical protein